MRRFYKNIKIFSRKRVIGNLIFITIIALIIETFVLALFNSSTNNRTMTLLAEQVANIIAGNELDEQDLMESLKEEYIVRAKAVAYYLAADTEAESNVEELVKLANLLEIDEINIFDPEGTIILGTEPKYYGMTMEDGEQISFFLPMLDDQSMTLCQDVTPNTAENEEIMYAMAWNEAGTELIQVGIKPTRLIEKLQENEITEVIDDMPEFEGYSIYVADAEKGRIVGSTDRNTIGVTINTLGLGISQDDIEKAKFGIINQDGFRVYTKCMLSGDYVILISHSTSSDISRFLIVEAIVLAYLFIAAIMIYRSTAALYHSDTEKEEQLTILKTMAGIYYSMHLIDLNNDILTEYKAQFEVKEIANHSQGATQMMIDTMTHVVKEEYLNAVLEFSDLNTLPQRMQGKKIISGEFVGKRIGWFRASFITLKAGKNGIPTEVMFTTISIDDEKKKEETLIKTSNTDELTQLLNRRAYEREINSSDISYDNLVYWAFDVNGLKMVNDRLGHAVGDELIIGAAQCLQKVFGDYGKVFRTGGDEFAAIINANDAQLEELKKNLDDTVNKWAGKLIQTLSISSGYVTSGDPRCKDIMEMAILADKIMYENKTAYYKESGLDRRIH